MILLGIDVGTSCLKAGLYDEGGRLLGLGREAVVMDTPRPGWAQCDPERWWHALLRALDAACRHAGAQPSEIGAVGLGVLFPCVIPLAADARALYPAILYSDQRSLDQVRWIAGRIDLDEYQRRMGNVLVPGTSAVTSMAWLRDRQPAAYRGARVLGFVNTLLCARMTGEFVTDRTMAALSGLVDIEQPDRWSAEFCERLDIDQAKLPPIIGMADRAGEITAEAARITGLRARTPVVCGGGDSAVSAAGGGALDGRTLIYSAGSTDCVMLPMNAPTADRRWVNCAYVEPGSFLAIGATTSSGVSIEWFLHTFLGLEGDRGYDEMTRLAARAPAGARGVLYLPYLQGERAPIWDPLARGMLAGLSHTTSRDDMARAVLEGTAFGLRHIVDCLDRIAAEPIREIRALGGGTRNALWNQIKADVLQKRLDVLEFQETGTLGAALMAGMGTGVYRGFAEAIEVARSVSGTRAVEPDPAMSGLYDERFELFTSLYPRTREIAHGLAGARDGREP